MPLDWRAQGRSGQKQLFGNKFVYLRDLLHRFRGRVVSKDANQMPAGEGLCQGIAWRRLIRVQRGFPGGQADVEGRDLGNAVHGAGLGQSAQRERLGNDQGVFGTVHDYQVGVHALNHGHHAVQESAPEPYLNEHQQDCKTNAGQVNHETHRTVGQVQPGQRDARRNACQKRSAGSADFNLPRANNPEREQRPTVMPNTNRQRNRRTTGDSPEMPIGMPADRVATP